MHRRRVVTEGPGRRLSGAGTPLAALTALVTTLAACGASPPHLGGARTPPDLAAFLRLPVATPSTCPGNVGGSASGRRSPWVGHVDISVFVSDRATADTVGGLGARLRALPHVRTVYFESRQQAYAEFRRLYTCSATVSPSQVPASYRLVLDRVAKRQRDAVARAAVRLPGAEEVSCDPSSPCTDIRRE